MLCQQLKENDSKWQERLREERTYLEEIRSNDVKRVQEKYETLTKELRDRG
jgi:predicted transcriptional regulator